MIWWLRWKRSGICCDALRPFAEACEKVDQVLADAPPLHDILPSDFIDCDEVCVWEAARLYEQATTAVSGVMTFIDAGAMFGVSGPARRKHPHSRAAVGVAGLDRNGFADIAADSLRSRDRPGVLVQDLAVWEIGCAKRAWKRGVWSRRLHPSRRARFMPPPITAGGQGRWDWVAQRP